MNDSLLQLYLRLLAGIGVGIGLGRSLPGVVADWLGQALFWVGVPVSILAFLRRADLSGAVWIAPLTGWVAILLGLGLAWLWLQWQRQRGIYWSKPHQGSFLLAAMVGNTGYIGYPVSLGLAGSEYFGWAMFYDLIGTTLGAYGLGAALASYHGQSAIGRQPTDQSPRPQAKPSGRALGMGGDASRASQWVWLRTALLKNPALWSFGVGYWSRSIHLPPSLDLSLGAIAWSSIGLSLVLTGMRLSQLKAWHHLDLAALSIGIKMVIVPLLIGVLLTIAGMSGLPRQVIVLQMGMPPAFATLVLAEAYRLDHDLTVTTLALGTLTLLVTLPLWLWLY